ncbi:unnamed protein product [Symbiodinium sp. KB8]|nr:unnamed protein product [Symbiodinium sp. KB8]
MVRAVLPFLLVVSVVADLEGQMSNFEKEKEDGSNPYATECGPSFCFDTQTANCFQKLPAKVCMRAIYTCVNYMFADTKPQEFCDKERKKGNSEVIAALATSTSQSESEKMERMPLPEAIWLMSLIVFGLGLILKHFLARPKAEITGLKMPLLCDAV